LYEDKALQARLSLSLKKIFWVVMALIGFTWFLPMNMGWFLYPVAAMTALVSIVVDVVRGSQVVWWTLLMLLVGVVILGVFFWIKVAFMV
jgi:hypothetical protein